MPSVTDAIWAFLVATAVAAALTPLTGGLPKRRGAVDEPRDRGLASRATPLLGGLAIFAGVLVAGLLFLPGTQHGPHHGPNWHWVLVAGAVITVVGAIDDRFD